MRSFYEGLVRRLFIEAPVLEIGSVPQTVGKDLLQLAQKVTLFPNNNNNNIQRVQTCDDLVSLVI